MDVNGPLHTPCRRGSCQASCQSYGVYASTRPSRLLSCTGSSNLLSVGLIGVVPWESRGRNAYLVKGHALLPAVIEHAESDVFMKDTVTQCDLDNCCHSDTVSLCLLVVVNLEVYQFQ